MDDDGLVWMGTPDAAAYIGITLRTLYRIIDAGGLPAYKLGRVIRVRRADLDAYLEAVKVQPGDLRHLLPERAAGQGGHGERRSSACAAGAVEGEPVRTPSGRRVLPVRERERLR